MCNIIGYFLIKLGVGEMALPNWRLMSKKKMYMRVKTDGVGEDGITQMEINV